MTRFARNGLPEKCRVAVQGFRKCRRQRGANFAENGHTVIAISDSKNAIFKKKVGPAKVENHKKIPAA